MGAPAGNALSADGGGAAGAWGAGAGIDVDVLLVQTGMVGERECRWAVLEVGAVTGDGIGKDGADCLVQVGALLVAKCAAGAAGV